MTGVSVFLHFTLVFLPLDTNTLVVCFDLQVWQMAENIYNDEDPDTAAAQTAAGTSAEMLEN